LYAVAVTLQIDAFDADLWSIDTSAEGVERMPGIGDEAVRGWIQALTRSATR
jgi:hypothetical protein